MTLIPLGLTHTQLRDLEENIKSNFGISLLEFEPQGRHMIIKLITNPLEELIYKPRKCLANEVYVGYNPLSHIKIDMETYPHVLITGGSGTGKSRLLFIILCNLIQSMNLDLFMGQVAKKELNIFNRCTQVKFVANNLEELYKMLLHIDGIRRHREKNIGDLSNKGIFNISDYNKYVKKPMKYIYVVIDEMSFVMSNKVDQKETKIVKDSCLRILLDILRAGRSSGIFAICCLQQPDKESLPGYLKRMFQCMLVMKQPSKAASEIVLGAGDHRAYNLKLRELLVQTNQECICKTPYIDYNVIREHIINFEELEHKYINIGIKEQQGSCESHRDIKKSNSKKIHDGIISRGVSSAN